MVHIIKNIRVHGSDIWWKWPVEDLLPKKYNYLAKKLEKSKEVFDGLFEIGCSQYAIIEKGIENQPTAIAGEKKTVEENIRKIPNIDLIVEGKDQSESWLMGLALVNRIR